MLEYLGMQSPWETKDYEGNEKREKIKYPSHSRKKSETKKD